MGCAVTVRDYWMTGRNLKGNGPGRRVFVDFWQKVELAGTWVVGSEQEILLFCCDAFLIVQGLDDGL